MGQCAENLPLYKEVNNMRKWSDEKKKCACVEKFYKTALPGARRHLFYIQDCRAWSVIAAEGEQQRPKKLNHIAARVVWETGN